MGMNDRTERRMATQPMTADTETRKLTGYASVFNVPYDLGPFTERVAPGAFSKHLATNPDIRALVNHDFNQVIGRTTNGTLKIFEDETGLHVEIDPPDTQAGRDIRTLIERGDISQMSFGFMVTNDEFRFVNGREERTILDADVFEVSAVTFPASPTTSIAVRDSISALAEARRRSRLSYLTARIRLAENS